MDIASFIPNYPSLDDDLLQQKIYNKTEFDVLDPSNKTVMGPEGQEGVYFNFQRNLGRLLSPYTPYNRMLVYYDVGVGKTCSAILVHELTKLIERGEFRETVVITSGPSLEQNFKDQFIRKCPGIIKEFTFDNFVDEPGIKRAVRQNFRFRKYGEFATYINGLKKDGNRTKKAKSDEFIKRTFSNKIFILDEGHVLKNKGPRYTALQRVFDVAENLTILILTGTPITEHPVEAITLINLLKPAADRMIIGESRFLKEYYDYLEFKEDKAEELVNFYKGYVTYLKQTEDIAPAIYEENPDYPSEFIDFKTYNIPMAGFQKRTYLKSLKDKKVTIKRSKNPLEIIFQEQKQVVSKEGGAFDKFALSSSIFVYPDGTYGSEGFKKNMVKGPRFKDKATETEILNNLEKYSIVFNKAFEIIQEEDKRVFYIYFDILDNLHLFGLLLEKKLGFRFWDGKSSRFACDPNKPTYVKITQEQTRSKEELQKLLDQIGSQRNADGSCIRVVLGSPVSGIGLTIPTATRVMIIGAQVSPENIIQIPARINRPGSLKWVIEAGLPVDAKTYLFAAIVDQPDNNEETKSIDIHVYTLAQNKIILNRPQYKLLKMADPFCETSYRRNVTNPRDNYQCAFSLDPTRKKIWSYPREPDETTDLLYWKQDEIAQLKREILGKIADFGTVNVIDFLDSYNPMIVYRTVKEMSRERLEVDGQTVFIKGDLLFTDPTVSGDPNSAFYVKTLTFPTDLSLYDVMSSKLMEHDRPILERMTRLDDVEDDFKKLSKYSQNYLWEESWRREYTDMGCRLTRQVAKLKPVYTLGDTKYNVVWAEPIAYERTNALVPIEDPMKIRKFDEVSKDWVYVGTRNLGELYPPVGGEDTVSQKNRREKINKYRNQYKDIAKQINQEETKQIKDFGKDNDYGFYGFIDPKTDKFKIVISGGKNRGKVCSPSFTKEEHLQFYKKLGLLDSISNGEMNNDPKIAQVYEIIQKGMTDDEIARNLVTVKNFTPPEDFTREETIAAIAILLPGGIPEAQRCKMLENAFREAGILQEKI